MSNNTLDLDIYTQLAEGEYQLPSIYVAAAKQLTKPTTELLQNRLQKVLERRDVVRIHEVEQSEDGSFKVGLEGVDGQSFFFKISFEDNTDDHVWQAEYTEYANRNLQEDEKLEMHLSPQTVECFTYLDLDYPQTYLMVQLAVLEAVAGECYAVRDLISTLYFSGTWLAEMAKTHTPISPDVHYVIHAITPEDPEKTPNDYWLHTHGLLKFGQPELEILRAHEDNIYIYQHIIIATANRMLHEQGTWQEKKVLVANSPQQYIYVGFQPWQQAVTSDLVAEKKGFFRKKIAPFNGDLSERDEIHSEPSMAIFANIDDKLQPLSAYGESMHNDASIMQLLPNDETLRMTQLAQEKFDVLRQCVKLNPPSENWTYLLKFACHSETTDETEHMWFVLNSLNGETIEAELINEPFNIPEMQNGEMYNLALEQMTDWNIYSTPMQTKIGPEEAFILRRYLSRH